MIQWIKSLFDRGNLYREVCLLQRQVIDLTIERDQWKQRYLSHVERCQG